MRFYQEINGIIWEFNSFKDWIVSWIQIILGRIVGLILGLGIIYLIILFLEWYGSK